ncbi:CoA pyrophosphatase [Vibrio sp. 10N]|uniref:CoA pyrophosphatase n=1 Tax=Vibrio sp. 10N TaxID=3058938 RepID=UPI00281355D2|nr:CoA pyrophosphatase [Vibrio sp. 10N]
MTKSEFLSRFQLQQTEDYHKETKLRTANVDRDSLREASVLIGLVEREAKLHVILTKRASHLKHHPGQISFPGGKVEPHDLNPTVTALRETEEEIGIGSEHISVIGSLPKLVTVTAFNVTPVLAFVEPKYRPKIDSNEVDYLFEVPLEFLASPTNLSAVGFHIRGQRHRVLSIPYKEHFIWGVTAQIIENLQTQLLLS